MIEFPDFKELILASCHSYKDTQKKFVRKVFNQIDYLRECTEQEFHSILFNLEE